jgi:hypothetical protein
MPESTKRQTLLAASTTLGAVVPIYVMVGYFTIGLQKAVRDFAGIRHFLSAHPAWIPVYDVAEATVLAAFSVLLGSAIFLSIAKRPGVRRLLRGSLAALPLVVVGSALGRYLNNPSDPMPGLLVVTLTILLSAGISMFVAVRAGGK